MLHHTTKYDGTIHYRFPVDVVHESGDVIVVYRAHGVRMHSYRGTFSSDWHSLFFFYADRYHNVAVAWMPDWTPRLHYVNIATPASWADGTLSAVDLDLDLILQARDGQIILDDEDEFQEHIDVFGYPQHLVRTCRNETSRIEQAMKERRGVFSDAAFEWRPGDDVDPLMLMPV